VTAAPKHRTITAKQYAADVANLKKARAALKGRPRTAKQRAASRRNLVRARSAQKAQRSRSAQGARSSGKAPVAAKKPAAPAPWTFVPASNQAYPGADRAAGTDLLLLPVCGPLAIAEHLAAYTGALASQLDILALWETTGACTLGDLLEAAREHGLGGERLAYFERCDPDLGTDGLLYGVQLDRGYHAALAAPGGMISWCRYVPREGTPEEAWHLEWEAEQ
jgi:hypothetical protein